MVSSYMEISRADKIVCYCVYYALPFPSKGHMTYYTLCMENIENDA